MQNLPILQGTDSCRGDQVPVLRGMAGHTGREWPASGRNPAHRPRPFAVTQPGDNQSWERRRTGFRPRQPGASATRRDQRTSSRATAPALPDAKPAKIGIVWLQIWNYALLPLGACILLMYVPIGIYAGLQRTFARPAATTPSAVAAGTVIGTLIGAVLILAVAGPLIAIAIGLHRRRSWAFSMNWLAIALSGCWHLVRPKPWELGSQPLDISLMSLTLAAVWVLLNASYFANRRFLFGQRSRRAAGERELGGEKQSPTELP